MVTAIDIAILPSGTLKNLAVELSKKFCPGEFHLNDVDILPHITLGIGFLKEFRIYNLQFTISNIVAKLRPLEITVERLEGRYLMCKKTEKLYSLHKAICDAVEFVHFGDEILRSLPAGRHGAQNDRVEVQDDTYVGEEISEETINYTNNFKWRNAYENWIPHITIGWDAENKLKVGSQKSGVWDLPMSFTASEIFVCQLGKNNTCRKVLGALKFPK